MANKIVVGVWDCSYCGSDRISGELQVCPHCGKPRGSDVKFYMAGPKKYVEDPDKVSRNPDWLCSYCDSLNPDDAKFCTSCGASREDSEKNYFENLKAQEEKKKAEELRRAQSSAPSGASSASGGGRSRLPLIAGILVLIGILAFVLMPKNKKMQVDHKHWERTVDVEQYVEVEDSGWTVPSEAYDVTSKEEISGYSQVLDHYETREREVAEEVLDGYDTETTYKDLGNGHFEEVETQVPRYRTEYHTETYQEPVYVSVPIYSPRYYYKIMQWTHERTETTSGDDNEPYYAELNLAENEREGQKTESYTVIVDGKSYKTSYDLWEQIEVGEGINAVVKSGEIIQLK